MTTTEAATAKAMLSRVMSSSRRLRSITPSRPNAGTTCRGTRTYPFVLII